MAWVRVSPGIYRDSATGKTVRSATMPTSRPTAAPKKPSQPAGPVADPNANPALSQSLQGLAAAGTTPMARTITPQNFAETVGNYTQDQYKALAADYGQRQEQQRQQLEQDLYNRGYRPDQVSTTGPGSWSGMTESFNKSWNDAYLQAGAQAQQLGLDKFNTLANAQESMIGQDITRELGMGQIAAGTLDRRAAMERLRKQLASNAAIARIQMGGRGGSAGPAEADPGFDILGGGL